MFLKSCWCLSRGRRTSRSVPVVVSCAEAPGIRCMSCVRISYCCAINHCRFIHICTAAQSEQHSHPCAGCRHVDIRSQAAGAMAQACAEQNHHKLSSRSVNTSMKTRIIPNIRQTTKQQTARNQVCSASQGCELCWAWKCEQSVSKFKQTTNHPLSTAPKTLVAVHRHVARPIWPRRCAIHRVPNRLPADRVGRAGLLLLLS